jgi:hypothetical protein
MLDTNSVNFAINKLSEGWQKVAPTIQDVGEKYVQYVVTKQVIWGAFGILGWLPFLVVAYLAYHNRAALLENEREAIGPGAFSGVMFILALTLIPGIGGFTEVMDAVLAITNPEMFTIHQIIEAAAK